MLRTPSGLVSLAVEGKAGETFAATVGAWRAEGSVGKAERLSFLATELGLTGHIGDGIRYQLLHRTASALIEGSRIGAFASVMVVASFAEDATSKADFASFSELCGTQGKADCLCKSSTAPRPLFLGWLDLPPATDSQVAAVAV
jgi:hypothetical protein